MHNDVGAEFDRAQQVRRRHGVVENQRQSVPVRQIGQRTDIGDGGVRVGDRLGEDGTGRGTDQRLDLMQVVDVLTKSAWMPNCGRKSPSASTDAPYRFVGAMMRPPPSPRTSARMTPRPCPTTPPPRRRHPPGRRAGVRAHRRSDWRLWNTRTRISHRRPDHGHERRSPNRRRRRRRWAR